MSRPVAPRGRLPQRVYWTRRAAVVGTALVLVFAIAHVLGSFGGSDGGGPRAVVAAQSLAPAVPKHVPGVVLTPKSKGGKAATSGPLSQPTGACADSAVVVKPNVGNVPGGHTVALTMALSTTADTCTWTVSSRTLVVKLSAGAKRLWSSQDCPAAIKRQQVVVRPSAEPATTITVRWSGHRSVAGCLNGQSWVKPGTYHLVAASLGGEPTDVALGVAVPKRPVVTKTPKATATPSKKATKKATHKPTKKAND